MDDRSLSLSATVGQITDIRGGVRETTRRLFEVTGEFDRIKGQEDYDFNELGLSESDVMYGLSLEKNWRYVSLRFDAARLTAEANGVAQRDYFIGVDEIKFNGRTYEHQKLEGGEAYKATLDGYLANLAMDITPFTLNPRGIVQATPWMHVGVLGVVADFEVDAGPATGLQEYENPPRTYVVRGKGKGDQGAVSPELGVGGEVKIRFGARAALSLQGTYSIFDFSGNAGDLGVARADKDLDLDYDSYELRTQLEIPLSTGTDLLIGAAYRSVTVEADSKARERSLEETLARREKFDKHIELELTMLTGFVGLRW